MRCDEIVMGPDIGLLAGGVRMGSEGTTVPTHVGASVYLCPPLRPPPPVSLSLSLSLSRRASAAHIDGKGATQCEVCTCWKSPSAKTGASG